MTLAFTEANMSEWGLWVLEHGLPEYAGDLQKGEAVPTARWAGQGLGAVLFVLWQWGGELVDHVAFEVYGYQRKSDGWTEFGASGGGAWWLDPPFVRPKVPPDYVNLGNIRGVLRAGPTQCAWIVGSTGTAAHLVKITTSAGVEASPVESPLGAVVVTFDPQRTADVEVLDSGGRSLSRLTLKPADTSS